MFVRVTNGNILGTDSIGITTTTSCAFNFGSIDLKSNNYVTSTSTFGGVGGNTSIVWIAVAHTLTITLGAQASGAVATNNASVRPVYTADGGTTDQAGGTLTNSPFTLPNGRQF